MRFDNGHKISFFLTPDLGQRKIMKFCCYRFHMTPCPLVRVQKDHYFLLLRYCRYIHSVELSIDFFVSPINSEREKLFSKRIGEKANSWWEPEIEKFEKRQFGQ